MNQLTLKQESFCQKYIETGNASEAYRLSYDAENMKTSTINRRASELMANGKITALIDELQARHVSEHNVTVAMLTCELRQAVEMAREERQPSAMVSAVMALAKLHGLIAHKQAAQPKQHISVTVGYK